MREANRVHTWAFEPQLQFPLSAQTINCEKHLIPGQAFTLAHDLFELTVRGANDDFQYSMVDLILSVHGALRIRCCAFLSDNLVSIDVERAALFIAILSSLFHPFSANPLTDIARTARDPALVGFEILQESD